MKTASRVIIIIKMAICALPFLILLIIWGIGGMKAVNDSISNGTLTGMEAAQAYALGWALIIIAAVLTIGAIEIVGAFALKALGNAKQPSDLTAMGILTIIFCTIIGGILMLCIPQEDFKASGSVDHAQ